MNPASGRAFVLGDNIDTDALAPGRYMKSPVEVLARHCLEDIHPSFAGSAAAGDVIVAGRNFGIGSSREQAAQALAHLGLAGVVARSFGGIFYRNAINLGFPVLTGEGLDAIREGDPVALHVEAAILVAKGREFPLDPLPPFLLELVSEGGLIRHLERRFAAAAGKEG